MSRIEEIRAREKAATPGPMHAHGNYLSARRDITRTVEHLDEIGIAEKFQAIPFARHEDAAFYAAARADIPYLLEVNDALVEALERARSFIANGIEFGYIKMPMTKSDPAHQTPKIIDAALNLARGKA